MTMVKKGRGIMKGEEATVMSNNNKTLVILWNNKKCTGRRKKKREKREVFCKNEPSNHTALNGVFVPLGKGELE